METSELIARAGAWATHDPTPEDRNEVLALLARLQTPGAAGRGPEREAARAELVERFAGALEFGTAGLRGVLGAGPNRMNRFVIQRTTWALAGRLDRKERGVIVGFDGRRMSRTFAEDTAAVLAAAGAPVFLFETTVPTPLVAFAVRHLGAAAGIMITASHNPPEYNGYKLYWADGAQIVPPIDAEIAARIAALALDAPIPRKDLAAAKAEGLVRVIAALENSSLEDGSLVNAYFAGVAGLGRTAEGVSPLAIAYTALHGVGDPFARRALAEAGFGHVVSVPEQRSPDPTFPTVRFPNPEEPGAMDLVVQVARRMTADLVLANDPDADRLAVAVPDAGAPGGYRQLTGNEVGVLLGAYLIETRPDEGRVEGGPAAKRAVVTSVVSSPLLGRIAEAHGVRHEETLTGFKWIARKAMELEEGGYDVLLGYEEALGYSVGTLVRDKDGISAAVLVAEMADRARRAGRTLLDELEAIHRTYGLYTSSQATLVRTGVDGPRQIAEALERLRKAAPTSLGGLPVARAADYAAGVTRELATGQVTRLTLPSQNMVAFELEGGSRIMARPSGTEPKLKVYFDVRVAVGAGERLPDAEARAQALTGRLRDAVWSVFEGPTA